jgi:hypothetical protein
MHNYKFMLPFGTSCTVQNHIFLVENCKKFLSEDPVAAKLGAIIDGSLAGHW